jgi:signal transduction histidine kinase
MSVRLRLTLMYAGVLVVCGALLLAASYGLVARSIDSEPSAPPAVLAPEVGGGPVTSESQLQIRRQVREEIENDTLSDLRLYYLLALTAMAMGAVALGWLLAGRALRPVHAIAATARDVSRDSLDRRVGLDGPEDELKDLADTIDTMLGRLDDAFANQQRFVANASHELRTPLAVIRAEVDVALADPDASAEELRSTAERVRAATERSERLIESLLTLSRSEADAAAKPELIDLAAAAELAIEHVEPELRANGLELRTNLQRASAKGDRRLLERLVANLVENAARHNVPGGWVAVSTRLTGAHAGLTVENSGPVVPGDRVGDLLEPFQRLSRHAPGSGAGLGLSIVRSVADAHGGSLDVAARPEGGLRVDVRLPAALSKQLTERAYAVIR